VSITGYAHGHERALNGEAWFAGIQKVDIGFPGIREIAIAAGSRDFSCSDTGLPAYRYPIMQGSRCGSEGLD
jgi:hypothetical protein